jgi:hypothetical protein
VGSLQIPCGGKDGVNGEYTAIGRRFSLHIKRPSRDTASRVREIS